MKCAWRSSQLTCLHSLCSRYLALVESLPTYGVHYYPVKVRVVPDSRTSSTFERHADFFFPASYPPSGSNFILSPHFEFSRYDFSRRRAKTTSQWTRKWNTFSDFKGLKVWKPVNFFGCAGFNCSPSTFLTFSHIHKLFQPGVINPRCVSRSNSYAQMTQSVSHTCKGA